MIDISHKRTSLRYAKAGGKLFAGPEVIERVKNKSVPKGDVAEVARSAGIQAAKRTSEWIVFCHSLPLDWVEVSMEYEPDGLRFTAEVRTVWKTGLEMEAITAVQAALMNAYDMLKPLQVDMELGEIKLLEKRGGKSDYSDEFSSSLKTGLLIVSTDKKSGKRKDSAGQIIREKLEGQPVDLVVDENLQEDRTTLRQRIEELTGDGGLELLFLCGGTGLGDNDFVPEILKEFKGREIPGMEEAMRDHGIAQTPFGMLSRQKAVLINSTLVIALPGSSGGARESLDALFPGVLHVFHQRNPDR